jgi:hypothetical protein
VWRLYRPDLKIVDGIKSKRANLNISIGTPGYEIRKPPSFDFIKRKELHAENKVYITRRA